MLTAAHRVDAKQLVASKPYSSGYESPLLRGTSELPPWSLRDEILGLASPCKDLLDIGCGASRKTAPLAHAFRTITALDPSEEMLACSRRNFVEHGVENARMVQGRGEHLPFPANRFDVVTCIVAGAYIAESCRVLRPGGWLLIETIGPRDQVNIKEIFGSDSRGPRGQYLALDEHDFAAYFIRELSENFVNVSAQNGFWKTWYTAEALTHLLDNTPIVRDFDRTQDAEKLARVCTLLATPHGIETTENRLLFKAQKPPETSGRVVPAEVVYEAIFSGWSAEFV